MPKRKLAALEKVDADLTNLQHKIKRDPASYRGEFQQQWLQYLNQRDIFLANPQASADTGAISFHDLIEFIAQVSDCYKDLTKDFPHHLIALLQSHHETLDPDLLTKIVGSLVLLRKKEIISSTLLLQTFFPLLTTTPSKSLRALLLTKILSDLRNSNSKTKAHKLNRNVQALLTDLVTSDPTSSKSLWAIKITREMWKRQIWTDAPAVTIMQACALSSNAKVIEAGVRFFLGGDAEREAAADESDSDDNEVDMSKLRHQVGINKKSKKADRSLKKAAATVKRREKKKSAPHPLNFSALHLLHNPQGFAEDLFYKHLQNAAKAVPSAKLNLDAKLQVLQLVSRLIGLHKLTLLSFYSYHLTYLHPKQANVTTFLATLAQGSHSQVPPDVIEPLVQAIADRFVSEASAGEVAAAGLNAIREVCVRQPLAMNETLLQDLVAYRKSKDKGVMMASKGLLGLFRQVDPSMLHRRDRGRDAALGLRDGTLATGRFGEEVAGEIEGLDLLEKWKEEERARRREAKGLPADGSDLDEDSEEDEAAGWDNFDVEEDDSDDSGGWIDVESDQEIELSDSDDDRTAPNKNKKVKFAEPTPPIPSDDKENEPKDPSEAPSTTTEPKQISKLATTRILTPADLAKLAELRTATAVTSLLPSHKTQRQAPTKQTHSQSHIDDPLTAETIEGLSSLSKGKLSKEEKASLLAEHKADHAEHKSKAARKKERKEAEGKSTTNKEKARKKNFLMTLGKAKRKGKRSLVEQGKVLKMHVDRGKRGGKRGNRSGQ